MFATLGGPFLDWVNVEVSAAQGKPLLALIEPGITIQNISQQNIVWLDRQNIANSIAPALSKLQSLKLSTETANIVGGFLVGVLALLVLRALTRNVRER